MQELKKKNVILNIFVSKTLTYKIKYKKKDYFF